MAYTCGYPDTINRAEKISPLKDRVQRLMRRKKRLDEKVSNDPNEFSRGKSRLRKTTNKLADAMIAKTPGLTEVLTLGVYGNRLSPKENRNATRKLNKELKTSEKRQKKYGKSPFKVKDACYDKVVSRYGPKNSAYRSGAMAKCRKVGAANWGNSKK